MLWGLLCLPCLFVSGGGVLDDEGAELVAHVHVRHGAARLALEVDGLALGDVHLSLGVAAREALHEALDENLQHLRQLGRVVRRARPAR